MAGDAHEQSLQDKRSENAKFRFMTVKRFLAATSRVKRQVNKIYFCQVDS